METEISRPIDIRQADGRTIRITADAAERQALATRFALVRVDKLEAELVLAREGETVNAVGRMEAEIVQSCAISAEDLPVSIDEPIVFRFVPAGDGGDGSGGGGPGNGGQATDGQGNDGGEEIELDADELDEIPYWGTTLELGEAVAQSLALAIDPFATGPQADEARRQAGLIGEGDAGPFAALKALKLK